jgi:hypothetical protein
LLVDPAPFGEEVGAARRRHYETTEAATEAYTSAPAPSGEERFIDTINGYCTAELCAAIRVAYATGANPAFAPSRVLFVSDLRSGEMGSGISNAAATRIILEDNRIQRELIEALKPSVSMLKFRPPFPRVTDPNDRRFDASDDTPDAIEYLDGTIVLGVWAPKSSTEVRLWVRHVAGGQPLRTYDCTAFEEQLYHYNVNGRYARDVAAERLILSGYCRRLTPAPLDLDAAVRAVSREVSVELHQIAFTPLEPNFTEDDARLFACLSHAALALVHDAGRDQHSPYLAEAKAAERAASEWLSELRGHITAADVIAGRNDTDALQRFWAEFAARGRLTEAYVWVQTVHGPLTPRPPRRDGGKDAPARRTRH